MIVDKESGARELELSILHDAASFIEVFFWYEDKVAIFDEVRVEAAWLQFPGVEVLALGVLVNFEKIFFVGVDLFEEGGVKG